MMKPDSIEYTCPNCESHYVLWDDTMPSMSMERNNALWEAVRKQQDLGYCKFCVRKDPNVPTTAEMDGLLTPEDMRKRFKVMRQCYGCSKWAQQDARKPTQPCPNCGDTDFDIVGAKSVRTFREMVDGKRKIKRKR